MGEIRPLERLHARVSPLMALSSSSWPGMFTEPDPQVTTFTSAVTNATANYAMGPQRTHHRSCNFPSSNIATRIKRSYTAIGAKKNEFCCGPRQGN